MLSLVVASQDTDEDGDGNSSDVDGKPLEDDDDNSSDVDGKPLEDDDDIPDDKSILVIVQFWLVFIFKFFKFMSRYF